LVVVTHRPSLLALVERIVIVDHGKVVMDGPKAQVLAALSTQPASAAQTNEGAQAAPVERKVRITPSQISPDATAADGESREAA
jgi:ATP-binding cassette subfamily C protein LapB